MIVITGLNGSGSNRVLKEIESRLGDEAAILRVPSIESERFTNDNELFSVSVFLNDLGSLSESQNMPSLKALQMFGAMLFYGRFYNTLKTQNPRVIFAQRHPLIDTPVFAKAYKEVLNPDLLDTVFARQLEVRYKREFALLRSMIPISIDDSGKGIFYDLLNFLNSWFSVPANYTSRKLKELFIVEEPREVYFLDASVDALYERVAETDVAEYHITRKSLSNMREMYLELLPVFEASYSVVNTSSDESIHNFAEELVTEHATSVQ